LVISLNSKFLIGRYIYCTKERFIYLEGEPVHIEPKMAELLDYLLLHNERYVPLQELHDEIWSGRIVTDTAVRRVISRVRALIEEEPSKPVIIKSLPKRGYRLFTVPAAENILDKQANNPGLFASNPVETNQMVEKQLGLVKTLAVEHMAIGDSGTENATESPAAVLDSKEEAVTSSTKFFHFDGKLILILLALITALASFYLTNKPVSLDPHVDNIVEQKTTKLTLNHFDTLPLNSRLLAISKSGELAFYEQVREDGSIELYLHEISQGKQWRLAKPKISAGYAAFVENDTAILFSFNSGIATEGSLQLWHLNETNQVSRKRLLISDIQGTTSIIAGEKPSSAFVTITTFVHDKAKSEFQLLEWDKDELTEQRQITSVYNGQSWDIYGVLSLDYKYLAYVRRTWLDHEQEIQILELATGKVIKRIPWQQEIRALAWKNEKKLLVLNKQNLISINIITDKKVELFINLYGRYWQMYSLNNKIYIYKRDPLVRRYIELITNDGITHSIQRERPANSAEIRISKYNTKEWYEVTKEGDKYHLALIDLDNPEQEKKIFSSEEYFTLLDQSLNGQLLLKVGDRVGVLKPSGEIEFINSEQQILDDAVFDRDGVNIIYSQTKDHSWSINLFDVKSNKSTFIRQGYKSTRVSNDLYIFWREDGELFKAQTLTGELVPLSVKVNLFFSPIWGVAYPNLYWLDFVSNQLVLNKLNLESHQQEVVEIGFYSGIDFNISENGEQLIIDGFNDTASDIYAIDYISK
jgi:DNA-binding winged helix-turn-helix (wHTH) protein